MKNTIFVVVAILSSILHISCSNVFNENKLIIESNIKTVNNQSNLIDNIGIETLGGIFTTIIPKGSSVPCEKSQIFSTATDNQDQITLFIYRGNFDIAKNNKFIGRFKIINIKPALRGEPKITITFGADSDKIWISAKDNNIINNIKIIKID